MRDQRPDRPLDRRVALRLGGLPAVGALAACGSDEGAAPDSLVVPDRVDSDKLTSSSVMEWKTPLLVLLGHTKCSAVLMTVEAIQNSSRRAAWTVTLCGNLVEHLQAASALADAVKSRKLRVIGAIYDLATGRVLVG
jgi:hypothetical protein